MKKHFNVALEADELDPPAPAATETPAPAEGEAVAEESVKGAVIGGVLGTLVMPVVGTAIGAYIGHRMTQEAMENISLEEEQILLDEANMHHSSAEQHLSEIGRIMELSEALEDLAVIADGIGEASPTEIALIENAGNMAVAGSDVDPSRIVPALEAYTGGRIAMEGIRETAATIWANIQRFLKQVWEHIEEFFKKMVFTIPRLQKAAKHLQSQVEAAKNKQAGDTIEVTTGLVSLAVEGKIADNETLIVRRYANLTVAAKWVFGEYVNTVTTRGEIISKALADFTAIESQKVMHQLRIGLRDSKPSKLPGEKNGPANRFPGFVYTMSSSLPGNVSLINKVFLDEKGDISTLAALDRQRNSRVELLPTLEAMKAVPASLTMKVLSTSAMETLLSEIQDQLSVLAAYKFSAQAKAIDATRKHIAEASVAAQRKMGTDSVIYHNEDPAAEQINSITNFRALVNFNAAYTRWAQTPSMPMMRHAIVTTKAMMVLCQKSLATYA